MISLPCITVITCALQLEVCKEQVQWAQSEKRTFLRQRIEVRLATLYLETRDYTAAISLIGKLLTEVWCMCRTASFVALIC